MLLLPRHHGSLDIFALLLQVGGTNTINVRHNRQDAHARHAGLQEIQPHHDVVAHFVNIVVGSPQEDIQGPSEEEELVQMDVEVLSTDIFDFEIKGLPSVVLGRPVFQVHAHRPRVFVNGRGNVFLLVDERTLDTRLAALTTTHEKEGQTFVDLTLLHTLSDKFHGGSPALFSNLGRRRLQEGTVRALELAQARDLAESLHRQLAKTCIRSHIQAPDAGRRERLCSLLHHGADQQPWQDLETLVF